MRVLNKIIIPTIAILLITSIIADARVVLSFGGGITTALAVSNLEYDVSPVNLKAYTIFALNPALGFRAGVDYQFGFKNLEGFPNDTYAKGDFKLQSLGIEGGMYLNLIVGGRIIPYACGGFRYSILRFKNANGNVPENFNNLNKPAFYFGGGFRYALTDKMLIKLPIYATIILAGEDSKDQLGGKTPITLSVGAMFEYYFI